MTIEELIAELAKHPKDAPVLMYRDMDGECFAMMSVYMDEEGCVILMSIE